MADFRGVAAVGKSIQRFLDYQFQQGEPVEGRSTKAFTVRTEDLAPEARGNVLALPAMSILLYRIEYNKTMRAAWSAIGSRDGYAHLALNLHYLLTPWADNAEYEHRIIARAMECLESVPILTGPLLDSPAGWSADEAVQICLAEISIDEMMRIFDSLHVDYKLSVAYVAQPVRIDTEVPGVALTATVTTRAEPMADT